MTNALATPKTTRVLLLIAACLVVLAYVQWGAERGFAALIGAGLSLLNWWALRWFTGRIVGGGDAGKAAVSLLLIGKIGLLIGVVYLLIQRLHVDPVGLAFGLGVLFIGPVAATLLAGGHSNFSPSAAAPSPTAGAAREER